MPVPKLLSPQAWLRRARETVELFVLPMSLTLLPWPWTLRITRFLSRWQGWYIEETRASEARAARCGFADDRAAFSRRLRWRMLIEHMDCFLVPMRGRRYLSRWLRVDGDPLPARGPVMFIGTHHGCGYWFLPYAKSLGLYPNIVAPQLGPLLSRSSLLGNIYVRVRHRLIAYAAGRPLVYRGNAAEAIRQILDVGDCSFGLCDMPTNRRDAVQVNLAGLPTRLAQNMFEIAQQAKTPVYLFSTDTDLVSGERMIRVTRLHGSSIEDQVRAFARMLDDSIRRDPSGWRFWSIAHAFFPERFDSDAWRH
jgi:hypothetical protein